MDASSKRDGLADICRRHVLGPGAPPVVAEPYVPYLPSRWNDTLVLAEAQNLSDTYRAYREALLSWSAETKLHRLGHRPGKLDIQPWDDGWLKIAVSLGFGLNPEDTGVSNAVLWSEVTETGKLQPPTPEVQEASIPVWRDMLALLKPRHVTTAGKKSCEVFRRAIASSGVTCRHTALVSPAPQNVARWLQLYPDDRQLLSSYPEVDRAKCEQPAWFRGNTRHKILFACHAVTEGERRSADTPAQHDDCRPVIVLSRVRA